MYMSLWIYLIHSWNCYYDTLVVVDCRIEKDIYLSLVSLYAQRLFMATRPLNFKTQIHASSANGKKWNSIDVRSLGFLKIRHIYMISEWLTALYIYNLIRPIVGYKRSLSLYTMTFKTTGQLNYYSRAFLSHTSSVLNKLTCWLNK